MTKCASTPMTSKSWSRTIHRGKLNGPFATIISVKTHKVVKQIVFDGTTGSPKATNGAEQCSYSAKTNRFYITLPGINDPDDGTGAVVVINPKKLNGPQPPIEKVFKFANTDCDTPQGTAVGPDAQLMVGCNGSTHSTNSIVIKQQNGNILAKIANEFWPRRSLVQPRRRPIFPWHLRRTSNRHLAAARRD